MVSSEVYLCGDLEADAAVEDLWRFSERLLAGEYPQMREDELTNISHTSRTLHRYYTGTLDAARDDGIEDLFLEATLVAEAMCPDRTMQAEFGERHSRLRGAVRALLSHPDDPDVRQNANRLARAEADLDDSEESLLDEPVDDTDLVWLTQNLDHPLTDAAQAGTLLPPATVHKPLFNGPVIAAYLYKLAELEGQIADGMVHLDAATQWDLAHGSRVLCQAIDALLAAQGEIGYWADAAGFFRAADAYDAIDEADDILAGAYEAYRDAAILLAAAALHLLFGQPNTYSRQLAAIIAAG
ncbi:MAG TPA: hypothetical protein VLE99_02870 [Candidatus Saccharimonadales bacterium]|nr:hypothetical protein [Candidatus Saccharimonadales bacterium]